MTNSREIIKRVIFFVGLLPITLIFLFPLIWMVVSSLKSEASITSDMASFKAFLLPNTPLHTWLDNYLALSMRFPIFKYLKNSLAYSFYAMILSCILNSLAGYALARLKVPLKRFLLSFIIAILIIPIETTLIPLYLTIRSMGGVNTTWGYILPYIANVMNIFLFRQFFISLPKELEEAGRLDGANAIQIFFMIIIPNCQAIFATVAIFTFIGVWNDFIWAIMIFTDVDKQNIQVALQSFMAVQPVYTGHIMAALTIATIPIIIIYTFFQKYIVQGMAHTSVKE
ncbi:MAG: carbohydrate ABC transporter permease [Brevinema sp.]